MARIYARNAGGLNLKTPMDPIERQIQAAHDAASKIYNGPTINGKPINFSKFPKVKKEGDQMKEVTPPPGRSEA